MASNNEDSFSTIGKGWRAGRLLALSFRTQVVVKSRLHGDEGAVMTGRWVREVGGTYAGWRRRGGRVRGRCGRVRREGRAGGGMVSNAKEVVGLMRSVVCLFQFWSINN